MVLREDRREPVPRFRAEARIAAVSGSIGRRPLGVQDPAAGLAPSVGMGRWT